MVCNCRLGVSQRRFGLSLYLRLFKLSNPTSIVQFAHRLNLLCTVAFCALLVSPAQSQDKPSNTEKARIYLLGEIHDNPNGHSLRLDFINQLISDRQDVMIAMEQFDRENQPALELALKSCKDAACVRAGVGTPGWEWGFYEPLVQLALDKKVTLIAANVSNADVRKVITNGFSAIYSPDIIAAYKLNQIPGSIFNAQSQSIQEGHCNMLPPQAIGPMVKGQIARDIWMASIINSLQNQTIILIAGNGHVRKDAGVYQWLSSVNQKQTQVHGYVEQPESSYPNWFDQVHVVPTTQREDQCLIFKKQINKQ